MLGIEMGPTRLQASSHFNFPLVRLAPYILGSIACILVAPQVFRWFRTWKALRPMPGPWDLLPFWFLLVNIKDIIRGVEEYTDATARIFNQMRDLCKEYTDKTFKVYIGFTPVVIIHTPDAAEALLTSQVNNKRPFMYSFIDSWVGPLNLLVSTGEVWRFRRKLITPAFHFRVLDNYLRTFNQNGDSLVKSICEAMDSAPKEPVELFKIIQKCAMDIIAEVTMGAKLGLQQNKNLSYMTSFNRVMFLLSVRAFKPLFWIQAIYDISSEGKQYHGDIREMVQATHSIMREKLNASRNEKVIPTIASHGSEADSSENKDMLMNILMKKHREDDRYTLEDVRRDLDTIVAAGNDTTTTAMCWTLSLLGQNPDAQAKVHQELDEIFGSSHGGEITADDLRKMKYLECCLKEALRLYPSFSMIGRLLAEDAIMDGHKVPKGVMCFLSIYSLHRNPKYFKDPEAFIPERFLSDEIKTRHPFSYIPFSAGSKNCIGQKFAMIEMKLLLAKILWKFNVESKIPVDQLKVAYEIITKDKDGNKVWFRRRAEFGSAPQ